jgi:hypothetical protein
MAVVAMERFVDREPELEQLTGCYESETADFVVLYGRRRLGKSELVRQSIADRDDGIYLSTARESRRVYRWTASSMSFWAPNRGNGCSSDETRPCQAFRSIDPLIIIPCIIFM